MRDIFISYSHIDKALANSLVEFLEANGVSCFIAPRNVEVGKSYASQLTAALDACKLVILLASSAINSSEHILNEVDIIINKGKSIIPVMLEDFTLNDDFQYYLGRKQWVVAYPDEPSGYFGKVLTAVESYVTVNPDVSATAKEQKSAEHSRNEIHTVPHHYTPAPSATKTVFEYKPDRGIMINPEDHQRNVSFRTDTLINMMGGIYENIERLGSAEDAEKIFFDSGYVSGKNFAERINSTWDTGYSLEELRNKLEKWCAFDSAVGWGKFSISIDYDEISGNVLGKLTINEAFMVDKAKKRRVCNFIKGYCTGVLETLMGQVDVELKCADCPLQNRFKCCCVFDIIVKG